MYSVAQFWGRHGRCRANWWSQQILSCGGICVVVVVVAVVVIVVVVMFLVLFIFATLVPN